MNMGVVNNPNPNGGIMTATHHTIEQASAHLSGGTTRPRRRISRLLAGLVAGTATLGALGAMDRVEAAGWPDAPNAVAVGYCQPVPSHVFQGQFNIQLFNPNRTYGTFRTNMYNRTRGTWTGWSPKQSLGTKYYSPAVALPAGFYDDFAMLVRFYSADGSWSRDEYVSWYSATTFGAPKNLGYYCN
jgi:hypothetical protein